MLRVSSTRRAVGQSTLLYSVVSQQLGSKAQDRNVQQRADDVLCCAVLYRDDYVTSPRARRTRLASAASPRLPEERRAERRGTCIAVRGDICLFGFCFGANAAANCSTLLQSMLQSDINNGSYGPFVKYCAVLVYCTVYCT